MGKRAAEVTAHDALKRQKVDASEVGLHAKVLVDGRAGCVHRVGDKDPDKVRILYEDDGSKAWVKLAEKKIVLQSAREPDKGNSCVRLLRVSFQ
jgi:hypothetical protein